MKKIFLIILALTGLFLCGCSKNEQSNATQGVGDQNNSNLIWEAEPPADMPDKAKIYTSKYWEWDEDRLVNLLIGDEDATTEITAMGVSYYLETEEDGKALLLWDGGERWGDPSPLNGGFRYVVNKRTRNNQNEECFDYGKVLYLEPVSSALEDRNEDYPDAKETELSFQSYEEAKAEVEEVIQEVGLLYMEEMQTYSITSEIAKQHMELRGEQDLAAWSEENEAYMFMYHQVIDGIPIVEYHWGEPPVQLGDAPNSYLIMIKDAEGIVDIECKNLHCLTNEGEEHDLIPYEQAEEVIREKYKYIVSQKITVKDAKLRYMAIQTENGYDLIPAWFFTIWREFPTEREGVTITNLEEEYAAVNAVTGKLMGNKG